MKVGDFVRVIDKNHTFYNKVVEITDITSHSIQLRFHSLHSDSSYNSLELVEKSQSVRDTGAERIFPNSKFRAGDRVKLEKYSVLVNRDDGDFPLWGGLCGYVGGTVRSLKTSCALRNIRVRWDTGYESLVSESMLSHLTKDDEKQQTNKNIPTQNKENATLRVSHEEEMALMSPYENLKNIHNFTKILKYFFYSRKTENRILKNLHPLTKDFKSSYLDKQFNLNSQFRAFYKLPSRQNIQNFLEATPAYKTYVYELERILETLPTTTCRCNLFSDNNERIKKARLILDHNLLSYEVFKSGFVTIKNQKLKLFKFILNNKILSEDTVKLITTSKPSSKNKEHMYLCISRNPIDYLFASTNQSFSSCISLSTGYPDAPYMGLGALVADPNRFIVFTTNGNTSNYNIHNYSFTNFRYINRSWGIALSKNKHLIFKEYPNKTVDITNVLRAIGVPATNNYSSEEKTHSLFTFPTPKHIDGEISSIFMDKLGLEDAYILTAIKDIKTKPGSKKTKKHAIKKLNNTKGKQTRIGIKYSNVGKTGCISNFHFEGGFHSIDYNLDIDDLRYNHDYYYCSRCDGSMYEGDTFTGPQGEILCEGCFNETTTYCQICETDVYVEEAQYCYVIDYGDVAVCEQCIRNYSVCSECDCLDKHQNIYLDIHENVVCRECIEDKNYVSCTECGDYFVPEDGSTEKGVCLFCYEGKEARINN